jgi:hypothetical protein
MGPLICLFGQRTSGVRDPRAAAREAEREEATLGHSAATLRGGGAKVLGALVREHGHEGGMHASEITAETPPLHRAYEPT